MLKKTNKEAFSEFLIRTAKFCYEVLSEEYSNLRFTYESKKINDHELSFDIALFSEENKDIVLYDGYPLIACKLSNIANCSFTEACMFEDFYKKLYHTISGSLDLRILPDEKIPKPSFSLVRINSYYQIIEDLKDKNKAIKDIERIVGMSEFNLLRIRNEIMKRLLNKTLNKPDNFLGFDMSLDTELLYQDNGKYITINKDTDAKYLSYYKLSIADSLLSDIDSFIYGSHLNNLIRIKLLELKGFIPDFDINKIEYSFTTLSVKQEYLIR